MAGKKTTKSKKARKKVRFKTITLKLTAKQKRSLVNYCAMHRTTPNKLIKKGIRPYLEKYADYKPEARQRELINQLELF